MLEGVLCMSLIPLQGLMFEGKKEGIFLAELADLVPRFMQDFQYQHIILILACERWRFTRQPS